MLTCLQIVLMDELIVCKPCGITFFPWAQRGLAPLRPRYLSYGQPHTQAPVLSMLQTK